MGRKEGIHHACSYGRPGGWRRAECRLAGQPGRRDRRPAGAGHGERDWPGLPGPASGRGTHRCHQDRYRKPSTAGLRLPGAGDSPRRVGPRPGSSRVRARRAGYLLDLVTFVIVLPESRRIVLSPAQRTGVWPAPMPSDPEPRVPERDVIPERDVDVRPIGGQYGTQIGVPSDVAHGSGSLDANALSVVTVVLLAGYTILPYAMRGKHALRPAIAGTLMPLSNASLLPASRLIASRRIDTWHSMIHTYVRWGSPRLKTAKSAPRAQCAREKQFARAVINMSRRKDLLSCLQ